MGSVFNRMACRWQSVSQVFYLPEILSCHRWIICLWLASQRRWVALKIKTAKPQLSREAENIERLAEKQSSIYIVQLLDSFTHRGPNGDHQCLVFELLGPSVSRLLITKEDKEGYDQKFRPETVFRMSTQLLKAVKFIHSAGMCHGGESSFSL